MSGSAEVRDVIGAMKEGAYDCVLKPFDQFQVMVGIERAMRHQTLLAGVNRLGPEYNNKTKAPFGPPDPSSEDSGPITEALYDSYHATVRSATEALGARDARAVSKSNRVVAACLRLGRSLGLSQGDLIGLHQGALLHDIGRIGDADAGLFQSGSLTQYEWTRATAHVVQGLRIIDGTKFLAGARFVVGQHRERFDGSGYPVGLSGDSIHLHARIFVVADAFDSILNAESHSATVAYEAARKEIAAGSVFGFDPRVVDAFLGISTEEWRQIHDAGERKDYIEHAIGKPAILSFMASLRSRSWAPERAAAV
jgi:HD-GYP domain-containing protein (c-di-GMP phosphodiesterase class II)